MVSRRRPAHDGPGLFADSLYRSLIHAVADPLIVIDEQHQIVLFNGAAEKVFGYATDQVLGEDLNLLIPEQHRGSHPDQVHRFGAGGPHHPKPAWARSRVEGRRADGSSFPAEVSLSAVEVDGRRLMAAALRDVTPRVEVERALAASERRFRALFEQSPIAMVLIGPKGEYVSGNRAFHEQTGYSGDDLANESLGKIVHADDRDLLAQKLRPVAEGLEETARVELRYAREDRTVRTIDLFLASMGDPDSGYLIGQATDVTHRTENQARLEELVRSKDELIASISHELRTPLTALVGFAQLLHNEYSALDPVERAEMIATIVSESVDLTNIVDDLLVAARAEINALTVARVAIDLRAQAAQIIEMHGADQIEIVGPDTRAWGDPARVRQILRNLVSNAIKYGAEPITIEVARRGAAAVISVKDRGEPIAADDQARIFEPYERAHRASGVTASMGLGLPISRQLASLMGGLLDYRRTSDANVFELELPLAAEED